MPGNSPRLDWKVAAISLALVLLVVAVFSQTAGFGFINRDDPDYVYNNPIILEGLSLPNIEWAFTHVVSGHWHPLTVMLFMAEAGFFGTSPGGYHVVNVLLHTAAVVLLFLLLLEMTGALWRSVFVAAVFAIHPLRAESVAWIAECKDVLSGVFFMLTLWAYVRYVRGTRSKVSYSMMLLWFALGLMSKPMLVTVPCVLLLLDYWPLGRLQKLSQFPGLLLEKLPPFVLTALSSMATVLALRVGNPTISTYPANTPIAYVAYLWKLIYPVHLAAMYPPQPEGFPTWEVFDAIFLLMALTLVAYLLRKKHPYLVVGWLWYLGMLVPVSGLMQTGDQIYADRYTYLPVIGLSIAVTWLAADWARSPRWRRTALGAAGGAILCALLVACWRQVGYWRDNFTLWTHAIECTKNNREAYNGLGEALFQEGRTEEAMEAFEGVGSTFALDSIGDGLLRQGRMEEAVAHFRAALRINPSFWEAHYNLGNALLQQGRTEEAIAEYREVVRLNPGYATAHNNLANALLKLGRTEEAVAEYREAVRINPGDAEARNNLGIALFSMARTEEAINQCRAALEIEPTNADFQNSLAWMLATAPQGKLRDGPKALELATSANKSTGGNNPMILCTLAAAYAATGDFSNALSTAQHALQIATETHSPLTVTIRKEIELYRTRASN